MSNKLFPQYTRVVVLNPVLNNPADTGLSGYVAGTAVCNSADKNEGMILHLVHLDGSPVRIDPGDGEYGCTKTFKIKERTS